MQKRSPKKVFIYHLLTFGLYFLWWASSSRKEINTILGKKAVPSVWLIIVPLGIFWWGWLYGEALEEATGRQIKRDTTFGLLLIATLAISGPPYFYLGSFSSGSSGSDAESVNLIVVLIFAVIFYLIFTAILGFFPTSIQSRINKLHATPSNPGVA
jgi:hypothetical protein